EAVVGSGDAEQAVRGRERLVRDDARMGVAVAPGLLAGDERSAGDVHERRDRSVVERDLDSLAPAGYQGAEDGSRSRIAGEHVHDGHTHLHRRTTGLSGDGHQPALGLDDEVVAGSIVAQARARAVDELRVLARETLVAGAEPLGDPRPAAR